MQRICTVHTHVHACVHVSIRMRTHARARACARTRAHALMHVRARARARAQACDALHPYNVQGRAQATYKDVREQHTLEDVRKLVLSWVPKVLVRWHVTGWSWHAWDTGHPAGCRRAALAPL